MKTILETERLVAREFLPSDATLLKKLNSDPKVLQYTGDQSFVNEAQAQKLIEKKIIKNQYEENGFGRWAIHLRSNGIFIGWSGLRKMENEEVDLGFRFHKRFWNKGFATEIAEGIMQYAFEELKLESLIARAMKENKASIRVLEKLGFHYENEIMSEEFPAFQYRIFNKKREI